MIYNDMYKEFDVHGACILDPLNRAQALMLSERARQCYLNRFVWSRLIASTFLHRLGLLSVCFIFPMSGRKCFNWDRKGWPSPEIQMYYSCPWGYPYKSDIAIFAWRGTWNYAYSPSNIFSKIILNARKAYFYVLMAIQSFEWKCNTWKMNKQRSKTRKNRNEKIFQY